MSMTEVFLKILNMSITAGWLILAVVLLRLLLKRAPKSLRYILWALVAIRLILPISFESIVSLVPSAETVPESVLYESTPIIHSGISTPNSTVNPMLQESFPPALSDTATDPVFSVESLLSVCAVIWVCGIAVMFIYCTVSYLLLKRQVSASVRLRDKVWVCDGISSPFILGMIRPGIYMPSNISETQLSAVEAHERMHIRHGDHLWKVLGFLILAVYWWNPLIWVAYILFCRDIELICDEAVVKKMEPSQRKEYSEALLSFSMPRRFVSACPLAFGEVGVKERIKSVLSYKKPGFWIIIIAIIACIVTAVCFLTDPVADDRDDPFSYDGFSVKIIDILSAEYDPVNVYSDGLNVGDKYALPGYGDIDEISLTVEKLIPEGKIAVLKLSHPLVSGHNTSEEIDTVRLMMDHALVDGIEYDSITLMSPDGTNMYTFSHTMTNGKADTSDDTDTSDDPKDLTLDGKLPDPSVYEDDKVYVVVYDTDSAVTHRYNSNDMNALKFYEILDVESFEPITLEGDPEDMAHFSLAFSNGTQRLGNYTVFKDNTVSYTPKKDEGTPLYFKADDGTFDKLTNLLKESDYTSKYGDVFRVHLDADGMVDPSSLVYSDENNCYIFYYSMAYRNSFGSEHTFICTDIEDYTLSLTKTDDHKPRICAKYDGKEHFFDIEISKETHAPVLVSDEGNTDFIMLKNDVTTGKVEGGFVRDNVRLTISPFPGKFSFSLKVTTGEPKEYEAAFIPNKIYGISLFETDEEEIKLKIEKNGEVSYADICIENGEIILKGAPVDFGASYQTADIDYKPKDFYVDAVADINDDGINDTVYIYDGSLSGRYSVTVTALCKKFVYKASFAYDEKCEFAFEEENGDLYLIASPKDSEPLRYKISCDNRGFEVIPDVENKGKDIFEKIDNEMITADMAEEKAFLEPFTSLASDVDGDGEDEIVSIGPGMYTGLGAFTVIIEDDIWSYGPTSYVSDSISQTLVKDKKGKIYIRAEYEDDVIFYSITPTETGHGYVIADENGEGIR